MEKIIISNERTPTKDGWYKCFDSTGEETYCEFHTQHWHSTTGSPIAKWVEVIEDITKGMTTEEIAHFYNEEKENPKNKSGNSSFKMKLPQSKEQAEEFAASIIDKVQGGEIDGLKASIQCKFLIDALTECREAIKKEAMDEAKNIGKGESVLSVFPSLKESGVKYKYEGCNDFKLPRIMKAAEQAATDLKDRQNFLKSLKESMEVCDEETGEMVRIYPPIKESTTTLVINSKPV